MNAIVNVEAFEKYLDLYIDPYEIPGVMTSLHRAMLDTIKTEDVITQLTIMAVNMTGELALSHDEKNVKMLTKQIEALEKVIKVIR